jgi:glucose-1-phosphate adenylyltransferase
MIKKDTVAIVLGGGRGTRLYPLTRERAKPAVPLAGKYRLIDIPLSNCINSNINRIFVLTQFLSASLHRHVYDTYKFDVFSGGFIELLPAEQTPTNSNWYQGTADAVRRQLQEIENAGADTAVILAGDHLYRMNYADFVNHHRSSNADVTLSTIKVCEKDCPRYGIMKTDSGNRVIEYHEKPSDKVLLSRLMTTNDHAKAYIASMGIYAFKISALKDILLHFNGSDFGSDIIPESIPHYMVSAYTFEDYWEDIGTIQAFFDANIALTQPNSPFNFYERYHPIFTRSRFLPPSRVRDCSIKNSVLAEGSRLVNASISNSVIGLRGVVRNNSILNSVVFMGADYYEMEDDFDRNISRGIPHLGIGHRCRIERAIIDKNSRIGDDVEISNQADKPDFSNSIFVVRDGITVIPKNSVIPAGTKI